MCSLGGVKDLENKFITRKKVDKLANSQNLKPKMSIVSTSKKLLVASSEEKRRFATLFSMYPRKANKNKALQGYLTAIHNGVSDEKIMNGISAYIKQIEITKTPVKYIKNADTWFNNECWNDSYVFEEDRKYKPTRKETLPEWAVHDELMAQYDKKIKNESSSEEKQRLYTEKLRKQNEFNVSQIEKRANEVGLSVQEYHEKIEQDNIEIDFLLRELEVTGNIFDFKKKPNNHKLYLEVKKSLDKNEITDEKYLELAVELVNNYNLKHKNNTHKV